MLITTSTKDFDQHRIFGQVVKSTYNMLSRALPKDEHFALALHILKEAHPELVPEKVISVTYVKVNAKKKKKYQYILIQIGMGIVYNKFRIGG